MADIIQRSVHHYTFTVPDMPWKVKKPNRVGKVSKDAIQKQKAEGVDAHSRTGNCKEMGQEVWWEEAEKDY
jgi:hypothetical protein